MAVNNKAAEINTLLDARRESQLNAKKNLEWVPSALVVGVITIVPSSLFWSDW